MKKLEWQRITPRRCQPEWRAVTEGLNWKESYPSILPVLTFIYDPHFKDLTIAVEKRQGSTEKFSSMTHIANWTKRGISDENAAVVAETVNYIFRERGNQENSIIKTLLNSYAQFQEGALHRYDIAPDIQRFHKECALMVNTCQYLLSLPLEQVKDIADSTKNASNDFNAKAANNILFFRPKEDIVRRPANTKYLKTAAEIIKHRDKFISLVAPAVDHGPSIP